MMFLLNHLKKKLLAFKYTLSDLNHTKQSDLLFLKNTLLQINNLSFYIDI